MAGTGAIQAEQSIVGSMLIDAACIPDVIGKVRAEDFYIASNREIFETISAMYADGMTIDIVTVEEEMKARGVFQPDTTHGYLVELLQVTPTAAHVLHYAVIVRENARRRALSGIAEDITSAAMFGGQVDAILADVSARMEALEASGTNPIVSSRAAMLAWHDWINSQEQDPDFALVRTGYGTLDRQLGGGFLKTGFYVIGGRPGMGKTTAALNIAERIAGNGKRVLFLSLEMSLEQIVSKRLAILSGISYNALYTGRLGNDDFRLISEPRQRMLESRFDTITDGVTSAQELAVLLRTQKDIDVVFVDYMGILEPAEDDRQKPLREQMTNISKALKAMAKRNNIPVIALSQLNRDSAKALNKRPNLADLRETGAIEQDADGVILIYRPGYYDPEADQSVIELIVAKNRHDGTGTVTMRWHAESGRITETEREVDQ